MSKDKTDSLTSYSNSPRRSRLVQSIKRYYLPRDLFERTMKVLRKRGRRKQEGMVLWAGAASLDAEEAYVLCCIIPKRGHWGGGVRLNSRFLLKLSDELQKRDLLLLAQVHSHPGNFGHSLGDEYKATSYRIGFVSIVVPWFALKETGDLSKCYVYEYEGNWKWRLLNDSQVSQRFVIENSLVRV
jgi:hypothetical protein